MGTSRANDDPAITPVGILDSWRVGQILCQALGRESGSALDQWLNCLLLPLALPFLRHGYKAVRGERIAGCAYVDWRQRSGYVFNVAVEKASRRRGVATSLMRFLAEEARRRGRRWLGLYVDWDNEGARRLYEGQGYDLYAGYIMRRAAPTRLPAPVAPVDVHPIAYRRGHRLMERFREMELRGEEGELGAVIARDFPPGEPAGDRFWRIIREEKEIGVASRYSGKGERTTIRLWLEPAHWGERNVVLGVVHALSPARRVDVELDSEGHLRALRPVLVPLGFTPVLRSQLLMIKNV